ncbi:MAG TPA: carboxypeptidase-like regulatory domain-containing protein [Gemmatimonadaceae bacterium]|nr:carboxypeptidase-like regulatory domain-containing protein [Gemmatimonadaceae bacterium]
MQRSLTKLFAAWLLALSTQSVAGQRRPDESTMVRVAGVAFDSVRAVPLAGAFVTMTSPAHASRSASSDALGRFWFDEVAPGDYVVAVQHAAFDSLGLTGSAMRVRVTDGRDTVRLGTPSFARLWRIACDDRTPPLDSGFVFGTVQSATTRRPVANAVVTVRWIELALDKTAGVARRSWRTDVRTDERGGYRACDVPTGAILQIEAAADSTSENAGTDLIDLVAGDRRVERRDLVIGASHGDPNSLSAGVVAGTVSDGGGAPIAGARVDALGLPETRTDSAGNFALRGVAPGTRQLDVRAVGKAPSSAVVDVYPRDTARVAVVLRSVTTLAAMSVRSNRTYQRIVADGYEQRRRMGFGEFRDSTELARHATLSSVFEEIPNVIVAPSGSTRGANFSFPNVKGTGRCGPYIWIDGVLDHSGRFDELAPDDIAAIEVYPHAFTTPGQFIVRKDQQMCGSVVVWTKRSFP